MHLELLPITKPSGQDLERLLNDSRVTRHMPLHRGYLSAEECLKWAKHKANQWGENSPLGPWAIYVDQEFAGWGGFQPEADLRPGAALVLFPRFWGNGKTIFDEMLKRFRENGGTGEIVVMLAKSRSASGIADRLGLRHQSEVTDSGEVFDLFTIAN